MRASRTAKGSKSCSDRERHVVSEIEKRADDLVELLVDLIGFDTTAREVGDPPREEAALQRYLADRLRGAGAEIDLWEPDGADFAGSPQVPPGLRFDGRPQLAARIRGHGHGRSLLLNGHIDVVSVEPRKQWSSDPFRAELRDGRIYGRGASDMKGGIAAMVFAMEILAALNVTLDGDVTVCTVTDEESSGAGGVAAVAHGVRANAGIVPEPSDFHAWVACRGVLLPTVTVPGRPGHAGRPQPPWQDGGAVNAIDKMLLVTDRLRDFRAWWHGREDQRHPLLAPGDLVPTVMSGGEWMVSHPSSCSLAYHLTYLPGHADASGWGAPVREAFCDAVAEAARGDSWLAANPPIVSWAPEAPAAEISPDEPVVEAVLAASEAVGRSRGRSGQQAWFDGASFTLAGTPCVGFGPGDNRVVHKVDEFIERDSLVAGAQSLALAALSFCGSSA